MSTKVINMGNVHSTNVYLRLEAARKRLKTSYDNLATQCGFTRMGLYKAIKNQRLTLDMVLKLADALNLEPIELFATADYIEAAHVAEPQAEYKRPISIAAKLQHIKKLTEEIENDLSKL